MKNDEMLAIADPKNRELVRFSVGEDVVRRPQPTGSRDMYIVRQVCQGPPFARWCRGVCEGGALPPTWDPPAVVLGDEEGNTFMGKWYCPPVTILSSSDAKKNTKKREEHSGMFRGWGRRANPKHFFFGISDFATVKVAEDRGDRGLPAWANEEVEWEVPWELLLPLAHPLRRASRKIIWDKGDFGGREGAGAPTRGGVTRSCGGPGHGTLRRTLASKQAGKALRSQGHPHARVM